MEVTAEQVARWLNENKDKVAVFSSTEVSELERVIYVVQDDGIMLDVAPVTKNFDCQLDKTKF